MRLDWALIVSPKARDALSKRGTQSWLAALASGLIRMTLYGPIESGAAHDQAHDEAHDLSASGGRKGGPQGLGASVPGSHIRCVNGSVPRQERGSGTMSKQPKPFEYKGKKKTRLPRGSLWRDGLSFSKWWRCRDVKSPFSQASPAVKKSWYPKRYPKKPDKPELNLESNQYNMGLFSQEIEIAQKIPAEAWQER